MTEPLKMATPDAVGKVITQLVGIPAAAKKLAAPPPGDTFRTVSTFVARNGAPVLVALTDVAFGASCGAALCMIPPGVADEAVRTQTLDASLTENLREVANVLTVAFNTDKGQHIKLQETANCKPPLPPALQAALGRARELLHLEVTVKGYPAGKISFALL
jgi:hypothetical protein